MHPAPFIALPTGTGRHPAELLWRFILISMLLVAAPAGAQIPSSVHPPTAGALTQSPNHHYFRDSDGRAILLSGSQTWNTLQDWGTQGAVQPLDFPQFVHFLVEHHHNFTLLWTVETPHFCNLPVVSGKAPDFTVSPFPWQRTGPGLATDGRPKFDLSRFNPVYFDRLRSRVQELEKAGIYAGVYLFTGEFLNLYRCAHDGYPLTGLNNINAVDDGYRTGNRGIAAVSMTSPDRITQIQDLLVRKMVDTLNDLPNVLWIVSEEAPPSSIWWNSHLTGYLRAYEATRPHQHPIGYAAPIGVPDTEVYNSDADWVAPQIRISPASSCGTGTPPCKVNVNDSDHSYFGMWNDSPQENRNWAWENFASGNQLLFMDPYVVDYPRENRNHCVGAIRGICSAPDSRWNNIRDNLGYILQFSRHMNLNTAAPRDTLCSTGYCLVSMAPPSQYLVYAPAGGRFTVNLSPVPSSDELSVEWFNPATGQYRHAPSVHGGSDRYSFTPPFSGDAVLFLQASPSSGRQQP